MMAKKHNQRAAPPRDNPPPAPIGHNQPPDKMILAIIGTRSFANRKLMDRVLAEYIDRVIKVVSGGADGADDLGARWARKNNIEKEIFHPDHKRYRHPYHHRNRLIAEACDILVAFWNGNSTGTKYTIDYAKRIGKQVVVIKY